MTVLALRNRRNADDEAFLANTLRVAALAADKKAEAIRAYDVRGLTLVADSFVMCTTNSEPHMKAVCNAIKDGMKEIGVPPQRVEGVFSGGWVLVDYGDVVVHVFRADARAFYDLDGMWADAGEIALDLDPPSKR